MSASSTLAEVIDRMGVDVLDHLDRSAEIPVLSALQFQGDVAFIPTGPTLPAGATARDVPVEGVVLVRGQADGNTHRLLADGRVVWLGATAGGQSVGIIDVPAGSTAYIAHPEHGYLGLAPGAYEVRRQREFAEEARLVAD